MVFLPTYHNFRNHLKNHFDGKVENRGPPMIMGPGDWLKKYEDDELKSWEDFFDCGDSFEEAEQVVFNMPEGMKRKSIFYELLLLEGSINISPIISYAHLQKCPRFYILTYIKQRRHLILEERYCSFAYQI
jgi:hypothetical protein